MDNERRNLDIIGGIAGIAFAILFVAGAIAPHTPDTNNAANWSRTFASSGDRATFIIAGYVWVIAALALLVALAAMWQRGAGRQGTTGICLRIAGICTIAFSAMLLLAGVMTASIAGNKVFGGMPVPADGDITMQITNSAAAMVLLAGGLSAALGLATVSAVIVREHGPRWLAVFGFIAAICCIFGVEFVPMIALPLWVLIASIVLLTGKSRAPIQRPTAAPAT